MPSVSRLFLIALMLTGLPARAFAFREVQRQESATLELRSELDGPDIAFAELVTLTLTVEGKTGLHVDVDGWQERLRQQWAVVERPKAVVTDTELGVRWRRTWTLAPKAVGPLVFEPPPVEVRDGEDRTITWKPIKLNVRSQLKDGDTGPMRDITAIETLPGPAEFAVPWWAWLVMPLPIVLIGSGVYVLLRKRRRRAPATAAETALRELDKLLARRLAESGKIKPFVALLTLIMRRYLEHGFALPARRRTTPELLQYVAQCAELGESQREWLRSFFTQADLVKFAQDEIDAAACANLAGEARQFIASTPHGASL